MSEPEETKPKTDSPKPLERLSGAVPVYFRVHGTDFAIPRKLLMHSEFFTDLLNSKYLGEPKEGHTQDHPIELEGISELEMTSFVEVLEVRDWEPKLTLKPTEWASALRLSTMWSFPLVREYIIGRIEHLPTLDPVWRIELARAYDIPEWLEPMYIELCNRAEALSAKEGMRLKMRTFAALCKVREAIRDYKLRTWADRVTKAEKCDHCHPNATGRICRKCAASLGADVQVEESVVLGYIKAQPDLATKVGVGSSS
ncbi:hypothetical protein FRB90_000008 [Tulasnella sp. 427]|nr:hypothetical protein FRB90_000008 [Tulasnella sp. 427]